MTDTAVSGLNSVFAGLNKGCYLRDSNLCALNRHFAFFFSITIRSWPASFSPSQSLRGFAVGFFFLQLWSTLGLAHCLEAAVYHFWFVSVQFFLLFCISTEISVPFLAPFPVPTPTLCSLLSFCWLFPFPNCKSLDHKDVLI